MFEEICKKYGVNQSKLNRNYYDNKIIRGERINRDDLYYCFIELNLQLSECIEIFNVSYSKLRDDLRYNNIIKLPLQQQYNREKNCLSNYGVINPSCLEETKEKRKQTNLKRYGFENSSANPEIKEKTRKTMNERFGGNAPACNKEILNKIRKTNIKRYGAEWQWQTEEGKQHRREVCIEKYGVDNLNKLPEIQEKAKQTKIKKYGQDNIGQFGTSEHKKAIIEKYDVEYISQNEEIKEKTKQTNLEKYGVENIFQLPEVKQKARKAIVDKYNVTSVSLVPEIAQKMEEGRKKWRNSPEYPEKRKQMTNRAWETRKKNGTTNTSKMEEKIFDLLKQKFTQIERNYKSNDYPFHCDFYIPETDIYIEYQGDWSHGSNGNVIYGPFDKNNQKHMEILNKWLEKSKRIAEETDTIDKRNRYSNAIEVWTIRDPLKRETAKKNNLNWLEFFTFDEFLNWYNSI